MSKIDFDKIRMENPLPDVVAASGIKLDKDGNEFKACCPFHGEKTASFSVYHNINSGWKYHCFGCGAHGDVIDYVKEIYGYPTNSDAIKFLTGDDRERRPLSTAQYKETTNPYDGYDIVRPPENAPEIIAGVRSPAILNPKRVNRENGKAKLVTYNPEMVHAYRKRNGDLIGYVLRVIIDGKKITPGVWWANNKSAEFSGWSHGSYPEPRPMYGLEKLDARPDAQVLLVEGEKCADAGQKAMDEDRKNVVVTSWMGGGKSISKTYWKSLQGRSVIIWPDNDAEGWKTVLGWSRPGGGWSKGIIERLFEANVKRVKIVHITPSSREEGWDIADAYYGTKTNEYADKLPAAAISIMMKERLQEWSLERFELWKAQQIEKAMPQGKNDGEDNAGYRSNHSRSSRDADETSGSNVNVSDASNSVHEGRQEDKENQPSRSNEVATAEIGRGFQIDESNWRQHLIMKADGDGLKATSGMNIALILQYERRFADIFAWNEFAKEVYLMRRPPWDITGKHSYWRPRKIMETDIVACAGWLEYTGMSPKINDVGRIIVRVAEHNKYNPIVDALNNLKWDGVRRISGNGHDRKSWMAEYFGAENKPVNEAFGKRWLVGAVARAMQPGCKMDTMLVLEGRQGIKKSTALRVLADGLTPGAFTDEMSDPNSKDAAMQMQGALIVEIAELDAFRRAEVSQIKAWLARQVDRFRRPYGKIVEEFPRSCVFAGTVNPLANNGYLKDATGARRFWPVEANHIDIQRLQAEAHQLWAEAVMLYNEGEQWWLTDEEEKLAATAQSARYEVDPYGELIDEVSRGLNKIRLQAIMNFLDIPKERRNSIVSRRVSSHMSMNGWHQESIDGIVYFTRNLAVKEKYEEEELPI